MNSNRTPSQKVLARQEKIKAVALELFLTKGYQETSLSDIIKLSGGSYSNIYDGFKSKEGLFFEILDDICKKHFHLIYSKTQEIKNGTLKFHVSGFVPNGHKGCILNQNNQIINLTNNFCQIKPNLFIDENDVIAAHAASVGPVDPIQMNYLMSRGIPYAQAERMVIHGFLDPVLGAIPKGKVKDRMLAISERKLINGQRSYYKNKK